MNKFAARAQERAGRGLKITVALVKKPSCAWPVFEYTLTRGAYKLVGTWADLRKHVEGTTRWNALTKRQEPDHVGIAAELTESEAAHFERAGWVGSLGQFVGLPRDHVARGETLASPSNGGERSFYSCGRGGPASCAVLTHVRGAGRWVCEPDFSDRKDGKVFVRPSFSELTEVGQALLDEFDPTRKVKAAG